MQYPAPSYSSPTATSCGTIRAAKWAGLSSSGVPIHEFQLYQKAYKFLSTFVNSLSYFSFDSELE